MKSFLCVFCLLIASLAQAAPEPLRAYALYGRIVNAVALDAASTTITFRRENPASMGLWGLLSLYFSVTDADNSCTAITMTCTASVDGGTTDFTIQAADVVAGVATLSPLSFVKNPSAITSPKKWVTRIDVESFEQVECTITDTGGAAADTLNVWASFSTK